jgi:electron transport complex protein RnfE
MMAQFGCGGGCAATSENSAVASSKDSYATYFTNGLWRNNVCLVQLLGMCPTMAVTTTATNGFGMGLATMTVMILSNLFVSLARNTISPEVRNPAMIAIIAGTVTLVDLTMNAWMHELYKVLGLFIALIVTNCAIMGRTEAFALKHGPVASVLDGLGMGIGFTLALTFLGGIREILGAGSLFAGASSLLGAHFHWMEIQILPKSCNILLAILPPSGFIVLGFMIAGKRWIDEYNAKKSAKAEGSSPALSGLAS